MPADLDTDLLLQGAHDRSGLDDFGAATFREGLDRLVDGLNTEARLNDLGRAIAPEGLVSHLTNRLQVVDCGTRAAAVNQDGENL
jgi:hypothetical protein